MAGKRLTFTPGSDISSQGERARIHSPISIKALKRTGDDRQGVPALGSQISFIASKEEHTGELGRRLIHPLLSAVVLRFGTGLIPAGDRNSMKSPSKKENEGNEIANPIHIY